MNSQEYQDRFSNFVKTRLTQFYDAIKPFYLQRSGGQNSDSLSYFYAHFPRFEAMINMIEKHCNPRDICEVGSFYPYTSYYFGVHTEMYDIMPRVCKTLGYSVDGYTLHDFNFNTDQFTARQYDLVIMSEIIEHLPIPTFKAAEKVAKLVKPGGHLLMTYPMQGHNACDYDKDYGAYDELRHEHLREFTNETVDLFFRNLYIIDTYDVVYPAYGRIRLRLYAA